MKVFGITRSFQGKATFNTFDQAKFDNGTAASVRQLLSAKPSGLAGVIFVSCGDQNSPAREEVRDGETPTTLAVKRAFPAEVESGLVQTLVCTDWGLNLGSATALNEGVALARSLGATHHLLWSAAEIRLTGHQLYEMLEHLLRYRLELCGYARNGWTERRQWLFAQNTIAIWIDQLLADISGFDRRCNGDGVTTVQTTEFGAVPLAGMEDYRAYLQACQRRGQMIPWGFVGTRHPILWDLSAKLPGTEEYEKNAQKIARQGLVMDEYARELFPDQHPLETWRNVACEVKIA